MTAPASNDADLVLISALEKYVVCPRQCALIHLEGIWSDNVHTVIGTLLHERADAPGYANEEPGVKILRALPLYCKRLGLTGKADVVEMHGVQPVPVEYKKGRKKQWDNDDIQLCAQAFCLEEMFNVPVPKGFIFHAASKRRREVALDDTLRAQTENTITAVREMIRIGVTPPAVLKPCCEGCSLKSICLPEMASAGVSQYARRLWYD